MRPPTNAFREALKVTASGACTVLLSTTLSCGLAIVIETSAHKLQYKLFPHWYDGKVKYAMGLPHLQHQKLDSEIADEEKKLAHVANPVLIENTKGAGEYGIEQNVPRWKEEVMLASDKSQTKFQTYSEKIQEKAQEKAQFLSHEHVSKFYSLLP